MDNNLTTLFIVPTGNTLPTTGSTNNLTTYASGGTTTGQFGIFLPDNTPATVGTVGAAKYIYLCQARNIYSPDEGTRRSDDIYARNVLEWYKVPGSLEANVQITQISGLNVGCNQDVSITLRLDSFYIRAAYANSLTRSVLVTTPCCNCGSNPCDDISGAAYQAVMQQLAQNINDDVILSQYVTAGTDGTGSNTIILIVGNTLQTYGQGTSVDLTNFPYQFDRMFFWTYVRSGPELTTDYEVDDACNVVATTNIIQRASYPTNTPAEIRQLEFDFFSYQSEYKHIFSNVNFNGEYMTYIDSALAYDLYYIKFLQPMWNSADIGVMRNDETVCVAIPAGDASEAATVAILSAFLGTADNEVATPTTSSSFTTSSTTTTTTTEVTP